MPWVEEEQDKNNGSPQHRCEVKHLEEKFCGHHPLLLHRRSDWLEGCLGIYNQYVELASQSDFQASREMSSMTPRKRSLEMNWNASMATGRIVLPRF